jgi:flagellar basal-body rod modification protein FlgD
MAVTAATSTTSASTVASSVANQSTITGNFDTFLQLLTTQLKNQNPLDPLDTNQFTQQLVQFSQVEQQMNMNSQLTTLIALQKSTQATSALGFIGSTVVVGGTTAALANGQAAWSFSSPKTVTITDATGQTAYSGPYPVNAGAQSFTWDGRGTNGALWANGNYTLAITAKDASGQNVAISTDVTGTVDGVDVTQSPPTLSIGGQSFGLDQIKQVVRRGT